MSDGEQLFPVSTEDWTRNKGVELRQVGLRPPWPESSRQHTNTTRAASLFQDYVAS